MVRLPASQSLPASCLAVLAALMDMLPGNPPTIRELAAKIDQDKNSVWFSLCRLRDAGLVRWQTGKSRTLQVCCRFEKRS